MVLALACAMALVSLGAGIGLGAWMDSPARSEPSTVRRQTQDGLRAARALLLGDRASGEILWRARRAGEQAGFYLSGAIGAELEGDPARAQRWLALRASARGNPKRTGQWLADEGPDRTGFETLQSEAPDEPPSDALKSALLPGPHLP